MAGVTRLDQAFAALQAGQTAWVLSAAQAALATQPGHPQWLLLRALACSMSGQATAALPDWERLVTLEPHVAEHHANLGNTLLELGRYAEARVALDRAAQRGDRNPETARALAICLRELGEPQSARVLAQQLDRLWPRDPELHLLQARIALALDDQPAVLRRLDVLEGLALEPAHWLQWAWINLEAGRYPQAQSGFATAQQAPVLADEALAGLGLCAERTNRMEEARAAVNALAARLDALTPAVRSSAQLLLARIALRDEPARSIPILQALIDQDSPEPRADPSLRFYLGRAFDASGEPERAIATYTEGHTLRFNRAARAHPALGGADDLLAFLDRPLPADVPRPAPPAVEGSADPVFLVGFPRSGTTLLEQLLDAHPGLCSFDEQPFLQRLIDAVEQAHGQGRYPAVLPELDAEAVQRLRARYAEFTAGVVPEHRRSARRVDKNPLNMVRLPLVQTVFPQAHVLLALRHPFDVVLSCWMQDFRAPGFAISFRDIASVARMYDRVFGYFERSLARLELPVIRLRYEDLVGDVRGTGQTLFPALGLAWDEALLGFTERAARRGAISTPSYSQVVQPVNRRAVGRWQRYAQLFDAATRALLQPWCERFGYSVE